MGLLGLRQTAIAIDGSPFLNAHTVVAETIAPGQTADMLASVPAAATDGSQFALFDANLMLHNNNTAGFGGMLTFLTVGTGTPPVAGPVTSGVSLSPNPSNGTSDVALSATISGAPDQAEYFVDSLGVAGTGCQISGSLTSVSVIIPVSGSTAPCADLTTLVSSNHTFYIHGHDANGWGAFASAVLNLDKAGPTTAGLTLTPNPSNGTADVALHATADDTASGGSNVAVAEYTIDGGTAVAMSVSPAGAKVASLNATITAAAVNALGNGTHVVLVRSQDVLGNWGAPATIDLVVVTSGPITSNVVAAPNPNNGTLGINSSTPAVRVTATMASTGSNVSAGEGFIDTVGANGTGIIFLPTDGLFNSLSETGYADIPLATIAGLSNGNHTIYVHAKDAAGNWGATSTTVLVIDKTAPTISSITLTPNTIAFGAASVTLGVAANDVGTGLNGGQYWVDGTATPPANPTAFTGTSATINTSALAAGTHTVYARVQDAAKNWSTVSSVTLTVIQAVDDSYSTTIQNNTAGNSRTQTFSVSAANGLLANDQPLGDAGRTTSPLNPAVTRIAGSGSATMTVSLNSNGGFSYTLTVPSSVNGSGNIRAAKRGTYQFTYTETMNGVTTTATVTITVN
jgi:hypothetical protein